jgi:DNA-binding CsgD family transcriptional regulator
LSDALMAATLDADGWLPMIDLLMQVFDSEVAGINSVDLASGTVITARHTGLSEQAQAEYYTHLAWTDPRIPVIGGAPAGTAVTDIEVRADPQARKSAYYAWEAETGICHTLCFKLVQTPHDISSIALARQRGSSPHSDKAMAMAQALAPRLAAAAAINRRIAGLEALNGGLERAMAAGAAAFALYGSGGLMLHANPAFQTALDRRDGLSATLLSQAAAAAATAGRPQAMPVTRHGNRPPYRVVMQPIAPATADARRFDWGRQGAVLAFLDDPDANAIGNRSAVLQQLYGLTVAEARVAMLIAEGEEVESIARRLNVAATTVRTQLKSVFAKMGVGRQLGVAQLVRSLPQFDG